MLPSFRPSVRLRSIRGFLRRGLPLAAVLLVPTGAFLGCGGSGGTDPEAVLRAYDEAARRVGWPGFDAARIPLVLAEGDRVWLLRHPAPPPEFGPRRGPEEILEADTTALHVRASGTLEVGGVLAAALLADSALVGRPERMAPLLLHEAFHVHRREGRPDRDADELDLFTYPVRDVEALRLRRLETAAARRALVAPDSARLACWSRELLRLRGMRFASLPPEAVDYERRSEVGEGLARYVEARASGGAAAPELPSEGYRPEEVRVRAHETGWALAVLLDGLAGGWKERLEAGRARSLDELLADATREAGGRACRHPPDEVRRSREVARRDVAALARADARRLARFRGARGWRLVVQPAAAPRTAGGRASRGAASAEGRAVGTAPFSAAGFDPANLRVLEDGRLLHGHRLRLDGPAGELEVRDLEALTWPAGPHPIATGIRRVEVSGIPSALRAAPAGGALRVEGRGVRGTFPNATWARDREARTLTVTVPAGGG